MVDRYRTVTTTRRVLDGCKVAASLNNDRKRSQFTPTLRVAVSIRQSGAWKTVATEHFLRAWTDYTDNYENFNEDNLETMIGDKLNSFAETIQSNIEREREQQAAAKRRDAAIESAFDNADLDTIASLAKEYDELKND